MQKLIIVVLCFFAFNPINAQNVHWGGVVDVTYNDNIFDLQADTDNNLIICGQFSGTVDFDPGPGVANLTAAGNSGEDIFVAKYDSVGNYLWAHGFGTGFFYDECDRVAVDSSNNIFITGMWNGTVDFNPDPGAVNNLTSNNNSRSRFLAKYDANGNFIAAKNVGNAVGNLPSSQDGQSGLGCDADGNVYMSGFYGTALTLAPGTTLPVSGLSDNYFSKFNSQLDLLWAHRLGSADTEYSQGLYVHPRGSILVLGSFRNTIDFDPGPGIFNLTQVSSTQEGYFASYDSSGQFLFARQLSAGTSATPIAAFFDSNKNIIVTGSCAGVMDADPDTGTALVGDGFNDQAFVAAYDSLGIYRWAFAFGDINAFNAIRYAAADTANNIFVAGNYNPLVDLNPSADTTILGNKYGVFIASYDTGGAYRNAFLLQEAKMRIKNNDIFLAGGFYGAVDFDPGPQSFSLQSDTANASWYLLRLHQCENYASLPGMLITSAFCAGDTVTFSVSPTGSPYQWVFSAGLIPIGAVTGDSVMVRADTGAIQEMVYVYNTGGCLNSAMLYSTVTINQASPPVITQINDSLVTASGALTYQWFLAGLEIVGATDSIYIPVVSGIYTVMITDSNGCSGLSDPFNFVIDGLPQLSALNILVSPNPFTNELKLHFPHEFLAGLLIITDISGKIMVRKNIAENSEVLKTTSWSQGVYTLKLLSDSGSWYSRIVKL